jgi:hypothetical protein
VVARAFYVIECCCCTTTTTTTTYSGWTLLFIFFFCIRTLFLYNDVIKYRALLYDQTQGWNSKYYIQ